MSCALLFGSCKRLFSLWTTLEVLALGSVFVFSTIIIKFQVLPATIDHVSSLSVTKHTYFYSKWKGKTTLMLIYLSPLFTRLQMELTRSLFCLPHSAKNLTILNKSQRGFCNIFHLLIKSRLKFISSFSTHSIRLHTA